VGTFAVQIAKALGAEVTAVCSARNAEMAHSIGASHVIDYAKEDFTQSGRRYDLIFAVNGYYPLSAYRRALNRRGVYLCAGGTLPQIFQAMLLGPAMSSKNGKKMGSMGVARINPKDLLYLKGLLESGKVVPVVDKTYPLNEVPDAIRYLLEGHARGKIVIQGPS
jgi:NADPH:quinone reductase-like Zn-dependent oxidoreductase